MSDQMRMAQPARNARPPIGVIAPSQRKPVALSRYKLPEKMTMPTMKHQPTAFKFASGHLDVAHATAIKPSA